MVTLVTTTLLELLSKVQRTSIGRFINYHRARIGRYMVEKVNNFPDELNDGSRHYRNKVKFDTNIIYEDSPHMLE